jgi:hypothetical protein
MLLRRANTKSSLLATSFVLPFTALIPYLIGRYHPMSAILTLRRESIPFHPHKFYKDIYCKLNYQKVLLLFSKSIQNSMFDIRIVMNEIKGKNDNENSFPMFFD